MCVCVCDLGASEEIRDEKRRLLNECYGGRGGEGGGDEGEMVWSAKVGPFNTTWHMVRHT